MPPEFNWLEIRREAVERYVQHLRHPPATYDAAMDTLDYWFARCAFDKSTRAEDWN